MDERLLESVIIPKQLKERQTDGEKGHFGDWGMLLSWNMLFKCKASSFLSNPKCCQLQKCILIL